VRCGHCGRAYIGMAARGKGGLYHYYACTARQKYGPKACQGQRVSREKLETAVLHQLTGIYRDGPLIQNALATAQQQAEREQPALDERRQAIAAEITRTERSTTRYFDAFEEGRLSPERCEPEQTKALLRILIAELRVNSKTDIQPTYRIVTPGVCATFEKVGRPGIEPGTLGLRGPCSAG
jgi:Recombinase zinc beta ribbon domain